MTQKHFKFLTDSQWELLFSLMQWDPPLRRGIPRTDLRKIWNSILYILTHGCRWTDLPALPSPSMHIERQLTDGSVDGIKKVFSIGY
ncbi:MAG: hypothetical protein KR126chlam4_00965 [Candidatus Anoxychlamydiales bacterium]|nr:hypothetical protein [Candidatus Anoxychlamydiales bacterium]HEU64763.1 transposase [Chlamydiota bacterium]